MDTLTYRVRDADGDTDEATITITVPDNPVAAADDGPYAAVAGTPLAVGAAAGLLANDAAPDGGLAAVAGVFSTAEGGAVSVAADGSFTYAPRAGFAGTDTFAYTARDADGSTATATATVAVAAPDRPVTAADDAYATAFGTALAVGTGAGLLANDAAPDGGLAVVAGTFATARGGSVVLAADGSFTYTPRAGFSGADSFEYTARDADGDTDAATASVAVAAAPPGPLAPVKVGGEIVVAGPVPSGEVGTPDLAALAGGGFLATWLQTADTPDVGGRYAGARTYDVRGAIYDASGREVGGDVLVNAITRGQQSDPSASGLAGGGSLVAWYDDSFLVGDSRAVAVQRLDASGGYVGPLERANPTGLANEGGAPSVAGLAGGGFAVAWTALYDQPDDPGGSVRVQVFGAGGGKIGPDLAASLGDAGMQNTPDLAALAGGGFVATWTDRSGADGDNFGVRAAVFGASGGRVGGEVAVNTTTAGGQSQQKVAGLADGGFVVSWFDLGTTPEDNYSIRAQRFDAGGAKLGGEILVNTVTAGAQTFPDVAALAGGGFVVTWDTPGSGGFGDVAAQVFGASGERVGGEFTVNTTLDFGQQGSTVAGLAGGGFAVAWTDIQPGSFSIKAQLFDLA